MAGDVMWRYYSPLKIFADNCLLYRIINTPQDTTILQKDLDQITTWISTWQTQAEHLKVCCNSLW